MSQIKKYIKVHFNPNKIKKPNSWVILNKLNMSTIICANTTPNFLKMEHIKAILFYIKRLIKRTSIRPRFLIKPRYWLTAKAKASRMGKGKGVPSYPIYYMCSGVKFITLPTLQLLTLSRLLRSFSIRLPFKFINILSTDW